MNPSNMLKRLSIIAALLGYSVSMFGQASISTTHVHTEGQLRNFDEMASPFSERPCPSGAKLIGSALVDTTSISDIDIRSNEVWLAWAAGTMYSSNLGITWARFDSAHGIGRGGASGLWTSSERVWVATVYDTMISGVTIPTGGGISSSTDRGSSWIHYAQPVDQPGDSILTYFSQPIPALPITTNEQNVTYDISQVDSLVLIASWAGGLRRSIDHGNSWQRVLLPSDAMTYLDSSNAHQVGRLDPRYNNNHLGFSVISYKEGNSTFVWCGTANGINKSTDAGLTWTKYNRSNSGICGNWATTLYRQHRTTQDFVWASTWMADFLEQSGLSFTTDNGTTWNARLIEKRPFGISSRGDTAYVSTDGGLYRTTNGSQWKRFLPTGTSSVFDAVKDSLSKLWVGSSSGLQIFQDSDSLWENVGGLGDPPRIVMVFAPDTVVRPTSGSIILSVAIQVTDPDSITDVSSAWFIAHRPSGNSSSVSLQDSGNGRFGTSLLLTPTAELGVHRWIFFARDRAGNVSDSVVHRIVVMPFTFVSELTDGVPETFNLHQNYPNPFNPSTTISFSIPRSTYTTLKIYNTLGQEIATLVSDNLKPGTHSAQWNPGNVASGVYYYRLQAGDFVQTKKLLLLR